MFEEVWCLEKVFEVVWIQRTFSPAFADRIFDVIRSRVESPSEIFDFLFDVHVDERQKLLAERRHVERRN